MRGIDHARFVMHSAWHQSWQAYLYCRMSAPALGQQPRVFQTESRYGLHATLL
jgi:hypothetical protein